MKTTVHLKKLLITVLLALFIIPSANAQLWKKLQKSAERTVERKLERKTEKETGKMMDSILDPNQESSSNTSSKKDSQGTDDNPSSNNNNNNNNNRSDALEIYSRFDFVPGEKVLFYDDFSQDFVGDFPSQWNTNGSGEVVKITNVDGNWFEMKPSHSTFYIPDLKDLPEDYTVEFDVLTQGLSTKTNSGSFLRIYFADNDNLRSSADNNVYTSIPFSHYGGNKIHSTNRFKGKTGSIDSKVSADIRKEIHNQPHIAIAVTKNRYRVWVNERKFVDIPRMVEELNVLKYIKFNLVGLKGDTERLFISNLRVAEGGEDLRRKLLTEGKISTNGILFNSGCAKIKPQSLGIVLQISQVLLQDENMKLNIVGHTDADGNSETNLLLSKKRAEAVKDALVSLYNIPANRLQTDGRGASAPVAENTTADGKAQNRRVEFIRL